MVCQTFWRFLWLLFESFGKAANVCQQQLYMSVVQDAKSVCIFKIIKTVLQKKYAVLQCSWMVLNT